MAEESSQSTNTMPDIRTGEDKSDSSGVDEVDAGIGLRECLTCTAKIHNEVKRSSSAVLFEAHHNAWIITKDHKPEANGSIESKETLKYISVRPRSEMFNSRSFKELLSEYRIREFTSDLTLKSSCDEGDGQGNTCIQVSSSINDFQIKESSSDGLPTDYDSMNHDQKEPESFICLRPNSFEIESESVYRDVMSSREENAPFERPHSLRTFLKVAFVVTMSIVSILFFLGDIVTDCMLANEYFLDGKLTFFSITLVFIFLPSILMAIIDLAWYFQYRSDHRHELDGRFHCVLRTILGLFSFGRVCRCANFIYHYIKCFQFFSAEDERWRFHNSRFREERRDYSMLDLIHAFTESAPQLLLQLTLCFKDNFELGAFRVLSIVMSWISIAWALVSHYNNNRDARSGKMKFPKIGLLFGFVAKLSELAARIMVIALFVSIFTYWTFLLGIHAVLMLVWVFFWPAITIGKRTRTHLSATDCRIRSKHANNQFVTEGTGIKLLLVFALTFCFLNLEDRKTLKRMMLYYFLTYFENFALAVFIIFWVRSHDPNEYQRLYCLLVLPIGMVSHLLCQVCMYSCFHPSLKGNIQHK